MKTNINRILVLILIIIVTALTSRAQSSDFSGDWKLNLEKSDFKNVPARAAVQEYRVKQSKKDINLTWITRDEKDENITSSLKMPFDGTSIGVLLPNGRKRTTSVEFSDDRKTLLLNKAYSESTDTLKIDYSLKERWQLIKGNKELVIELTSPAYSIKAVYDRLPVLTTSSNR